MFNKIFNKFQLLILLLVKKVRFFDSKNKRKFYRFFFKKKINILNSEIKIDENKGYLYLKKKSFLNEEKLIESCLKDSFHLFNNYQNSSGTKKYLRNILQDEHESQLKNYLNFFLNKKIINIVQGYLGTKPLLVELKLLHSPVLKNNEAKEGSQLFHCDFDDDKIIKIFLNISHVNYNSGPLQTLNAEQSNKIRINENLNLGDHTNAIEKKIKPEDIKTFVGVPGDVLFIDTSSCFHRGSIDTKEDRLILYANFVSRSSYRFPPLFKNSKDKNIIINHSPLYEFSQLVDNNKKQYLINS